MKLTLSIPLVAFALLGSFCNPEANTPPQPPPPNVDGGGGVDDCDAACERLAELCKLDALECKAACINAESSGIITFCPAFVARATTCEEAKRFSQCDESP